MRSQAAHTALIFSQQIEDLKKSCYLLFCMLFVSYAFKIEDFNGKDKSLFVSLIFDFNKQKILSVSCFPFKYSS